MREYHEATVICDSDSRLIHVDIPSLGYSFTMFGECSVVGGNNDGGVDDKTIGSVCTSVALRLEWRNMVGIA